MQTLRNALICFVLVILFLGCANMPTAPGQITGSYTSGLRYENYNCSQLAIELNGLARRESQLVIAQEQIYILAFALSSLAIGDGGRSVLVLSVVFGCWLYLPAYRWICR